MIAAGGAFDGMSLRRVTFPGYSFLPPAAHFSHQLEKWAKEPFETDGFKTSFALKSCVRYGLERELTLQQTRCRSHSGEGACGSIAGK